MKIPNAEHAVIAEEKIRGYLLNIRHTRGGSKAVLLLSFGYKPARWQQLAEDLRQYHLPLEVFQIRRTSYGNRYEIRAPLITPVGRPLTIRSIWQTDVGSSVPRLITLYPD